MKVVIKNSERFFYTSDGSVLKSMQEMYKWLKECSFETYGCSNVRMILPNLSNELSHIVASENGDSL